MLSPEEKELIKESYPELYEKIEFLEKAALEGTQLKTELMEKIGKIWSNPEVKEEFLKVIKKAGIEDIPVESTPLDHLYKKIDKTEEELKRLKRLQEERERVMRALEEYGITEDEYEDLIRFQKEYGIRDNVKAIELYAKIKRMRGYEEIEPVRKISITPPSEYTIEEAYKRTIEELRKAKLI